MKDKKTSNILGQYHCQALHNFYSWLVKHNAAGVVIIALIYFHMLWSLFMPVRSSLSYRAGCVLCLEPQRSWRLKRLKVCNVDLSHWSLTWDSNRFLVWFQGARCVHFLTSSGEVAVGIVESTPTALLQGLGKGNFKIWAQQESRTAEVIHIGHLWITLAMKIVAHQCIACLSSSTCASKSPSIVGCSQCRWEQYTDI